MGGQGPLGRGEVHGHHHVAPGKGAGDEVQPQPLLGDGLQRGVALAVEHGGNLGGAGQHRPVNHHGHAHHGHHGVAQDGGQAFPIPDAVAAAEDGLDALGNPRVNGDDHQG